VRRHQSRSGPVATGPTFVNLYDRIASLERRVAHLESGRGEGARSASPSSEEQAPLAEPVSWAMQHFV
jgi:hypothetical protein